MGDENMKGLMERIGDLNGIELGYAYGFLSYFGWVLEGFYGLGLDYEGFWSFFGVEEGLVF